MIPGQPLTTHFKGPKHTVITFTASNYSTLKVSKILSTPLAGGEYDTILTYYLLDEQDAVISAIPMKLKISVEG